MKRILPAAVLAALAGVNGAQAVHINPEGLGQVLLYPFYTVENGQDTYINLVNTTDQVKAVKVRILESMNSQEVLDFNLYLSPQDHWSAVITSSAEGATLTSADTSCTVPAAVSNGDTIEFREFTFPLDSVNTRDRTREGYIEIIEMGEVINLPTRNFANAATHNALGVPADCARLNTAWNTTDGFWGAVPGGTPLGDLVPPAGGLYGYGVLINVEEGTDATYDAVALDDFDDGLPLHTNPGSILPSLGSGTEAFNVIDGDQVISGFGGNPTAVGAAARTIQEGLDAVSAVLMVRSIANDYVLEPSIGAGTDWVITMPTKRDYVAVTPAEAPFLTPWDIVTSTSCEEFGISYWDREEATPTAPPSELDFSPRPPGIPDVPFSLCAEANVLSFSGSNVLESMEAGRSFRNFNLADGWNNGWAVLDFVTAAARPALETEDDVGTLDDGAFLEFFGLPIIGFAVQKYVNGNVGGVLSNYAGSVTHKGTRDIVIN